ELGFYGMYGDEINWGGWLRCESIDLSKLLHNSFTPPLDNIKRGINKYLIHNVYDVKPDEFTLNLKNESYDFFFTKSGQKKYLESPNFRMQTNILNTNNDKFIVTDKNGTIFSFLEGVINETPWTRSIPSVTPEDYVEPWYPSFCSAYLLSNIDFPNGHSVEFHYRQDTRAKKNQNRTLYWEPNNPCPPQEGSETMISSKIIVEKRAILDSIITPLEKVEFVYEEYEDPNYYYYGYDYYPTNTGTQHKLVSIIVKDYMDNEIKRLLFTYDTYYDNRTRLRSISVVTGEENILLRHFEYDTQFDDNIHTIFKQDCFGYYNNNTQSHLFPDYPNGNSANRSYDSERIYAGMLNKVVFETGGYVEIEYTPKVMEAMFNDDTYIFYAGGVVPKKYTYFDSNSSLLFSRIYDYGSKLYGIYQDVSGFRGYSTGKAEGNPGVYYGYSIYWDQVRENLNPLFFNYDEFDDFMRRRGSFYGRIDVKTIGNNNNQNGTIVTNYQPSKNRFSFSPKKVKERFFKEGETFPTKTINYSYNDEFQESNSLFFVDLKETIYNHLFNLFKLETRVYNYLTTPRYFYYDVNEKLSGKEIIERTDNGQIIELSSYQYNTKGLLTKHLTSQSDGDTLTTEYRYPIDFIIYSPVHNESTDIVALRSMISKNMISLPVEVVNYRNDQVIGGKFILYQNNVHGIPLPSTTYNLETNNPLPVSPKTDTPTTFTPSGIKYDGYNFYLSKDNSYAKNSLFDRYDDYGNLIQYHREADVPTSYIWGYNQILPIAEVKNAAYHQISYSSFETPENKGNWRFNNSPSNYDLIASRTGSRSFKLYNSHISYYLDPGTYMLSYWLKGGSTTFLGGTVEDIYQSEPYPNGWVLHKKKVVISAPTIFRISGGGPNIRIDELRLHPIDAQMTTYTHDPLVGLTSVTDANGRTQYYEYDGLGRLVGVRDDEGNLLEQHEYRYREGELPRLEEAQRREAPESSKPSTPLLTPNAE
ncbi:MAG TPA: hypothetical protein DG754_00850, partial [Bacteroidales bacterium]|nr:hypothetical protein [Bacteroidales bacterium]